MSSTRNTILNAFKQVIDAIPSGPFGQLRTVIGVLRPADLGPTPAVEIWWHNDAGGHVDRNSERVIRVVTAVKFKHDATDTASRGQTRLLQASELYDAIHAAIETAFNDRGGGGTPFSGMGYLNITQEDEGIQCDGFGDGDDYMRIGEVWRVTYRRSEGAA